jgi:hypothetical protein
MNILTAIINSVLVMIVAGCASVPMAPPDEDLRAKNFTSPPDKAVLYLYRNEIMASAIAMTVVMNGKKIGQTGPQTYFRLELSPGNYAIESYAGDVSKFDLVVREGKTYYVWQEVKSAAPMAGSLLQLVSESVGRAGVKESKLIAASIPGDAVSPRITGAAAPLACRSTGEAFDQGPHDGTAFLSAPPDAALIYIVRTSRFLSAANSYRLNVNGVPVADMGSGEFVTCVVAPGMTQILAQPLPRMLMGPMALAMMETSELALDAKPGRVYFVDVQIAFSGGPSLVVSNEADSRAGIKGTTPSRRFEIKQ